MIKIAVCDDEENIRNYLSDLIRRQSVPCEVRKFASAGQYLTGDWDADLLFLDIEMRSFGSGPDGMSLARKIRGRNLEVQPLIVFVTGYESYVYDAFDVGAFHYLLKPLSEEKFSEVFFRAVRQIAGGGAGVPAVRSLTVRCSNGVRRIPICQVYYAESSNHKVVLHLKGETLAYNGKLGELEQELREDFCRIHKGYLVNLAYVTAYSRTEAVLEGGEKLQISKYKYQDFAKAFLRYLKRRAAYE